MLRQRSLQSFLPCLGLFLKLGRLRQAFPMCILASVGNPHWWANTCSTKILRMRPNSYHESHMKAIMDPFFCFLLIPPHISSHSVNRNETKIRDPPKSSSFIRPCFPEGVSFVLWDQTMNLLSLFLRLLHCYVPTLLCFFNSSYGGLSKLTNITKMKQNPPWQALHEVASRLSWSAKQSHVG